MARHALASIATILILAASPPASAASLSSCQETITRFQDLGNVSEMLAESYGHAVLRTFGKGGLMYEASIGGQKYSFKPLK